MIPARRGGNKNAPVHATNAPPPEKAREARGLRAAEPVAEKENPAAGGKIRVRAVPGQQDFRSFRTVPLVGDPVRAARDSRNPEGRRDERGGDGENGAPSPASPERDRRRGDPARVQERIRISRDDRRLRPAHERSRNVVEKPAQKLDRRRNDETHRRERNEHVYRGRVYERDKGKRHDHVDERRDERRTTEEREHERQGGELHRAGNYRWIDEDAHRRSPRSTRRHLSERAGDRNAEHGDPEDGREGELEPRVENGRGVDGRDGERPDDERTE